MDEQSIESASRARRRSGAVALAALLALVLGAVGARAVSLERSLGWDESMHAALPAARILLAARAGELREAADVVLDCQQYPPAYPLYLAASQALFGLDERVARGASRALWAAGLFGLFLLGRATVRRLARDGRGPVRGAALVPWLLPAIGLLSPMALAFSGTLFLEVPFMAVAAFALWAWMRRDGATTRAERWRADLLAGALLALCFFTKFNYALLLGLGLFADLAFESVGALRAGRARAVLERAAALALVPVLGWLWWFVLPLPGGAAVAASHREAFLAFLGGNTQLAVTPYGLRLWDAATFLAPSTRGLALLLLGAALGAAWIRRPAVRTLALVALAGYGPVLAHNFHLERFLLPPALAVWALAALGLARLAPARPGPRAAALAGLAGLALLWPTADASVVPRLFGLRTDDNAAYLDGLHAERLSLAPSRPLPTAGLARAEHDALLDAVAAAAGPDARVGWLGINSELSPAAIHLGLLARGGSPARLRRDAGRVRDDGQPAMVLTFLDADPSWSDERLRAWAAGFDVLFTTEPLVWKGRGGRRFLGRYRDVLFAAGDWAYERVARLALTRAAGAPQPLELFACRPAAE